ncbi:PAS domain S-box protein [Stieleria mannarensis]|uniref:PAS domain S-box protein n=1 Tax=Stieleria mannarensis TaxID=2755585 RepID=UPI0015FF0D1F|nr:PAS domain S-box protein [Rhodopirellula sp. JC639]
MPRVEETRSELLAQLAEIQAKLARLNQSESVERAAPAEQHRANAAGSIDVAPRDPGRADVGLIEWDANDAISRWSPQAEQIFGWKAEEVLGKCWDEFRLVHEQDIALVQQANRELLEGHVDFNTSFNRNYRKDGTVLNCEWFNAVRRNDQGEIVAVVSLPHDVTGRVRAESHMHHFQNAMRMITIGTSRSTGLAFFQALVRYISQSLGFRSVFVARIDQEHPHQARTIAFWSDGQLAENFTYPLAGSPTQNTVINRSMEFSADGVQRRFPNDATLARFHAEGYLATPLVGSDGDVLGVLAVMDDKPMEDRGDIREMIALFGDRTAIEIERSIAEASQHASRTRLRVLTEQLPAVLWTTDLELRFTHSTGAGLKSLNQKPGQSVGQTLFEYFQTDDETYGPIAIHFRALQGISGTSVVEWAGLVFQVYVEPLRDPSGQIIGTIGLAQDISELKRVEHSLIQSEERFRRLIQHAPEAVVLLDTKTGRFVMVNEAAEKLYKYPAEQLLQMGPLDISPVVQADGQLSAEKSREVISKACAGETPIFEWTHRDALGSEIPCEIRLLSLAEGGRTIIRGSVTDVTEKKRAEESLKRLESELAHVARVSTMGEMVGGLAHELNQPLYAIQNFGKACGNLVAAEGVIDRDRLHQWLDKITSTAQFAGEILTRLRSFVSREPINKTTIDLDEIIQSALMLTKHDAQVAGIRVEYAPASLLPPVKADNVHIQQVLVNLIKNAFDAVQNQSVGEPVVRISTEKLGDLVAVTVADNGPGLPPGNVPIFEAFCSTKTNALGLGLAISTTIVKAHGGTLQANNGAEFGAVFRFTLATAPEND